MKKNPNQVKLGHITYEILSNRENQEVVKQLETLTAEFLEIVHSTEGGRKLFENGFPGDPPFSLEQTIPIYLALEQEMRAGTPIVEYSIGLSPLLFMIHKLHPEIKTLINAQIDIASQEESLAQKLGFQTQRTSFDRIRYPKRKSILASMGGYNVKDEFSNGRGGTDYDSTIIAIFQQASRLRKGSVIITQVEIRGQDYGEGTKNPERTISEITNRLRSRNGETWEDIFLNGIVLTDTIQTRAVISTYDGENVDGVVYISKVL